MNNKVQQRFKTLCAIRYHQNTGDAELVIYVNNIRRESFTYYEEDGGLRAAKEMAAKMSDERPFIRNA